MQLTPYLNFQGDCEEALNFYKKIFGGEIQDLQRYDNPAMRAPEEYKNKILHSVYTFRGNQVYASDVFPGGSASGNNIALSLAADNIEEAKSMFNQLAEGGTIRVPFLKQFWGAWHGNLIDKYGILWMMNFEEK